MRVHMKVLIPLLFTKLGQPIEAEACCLPKYANSASCVLDQWFGIGCFIVSLCVIQLLLLFCFEMLVCQNGFDDRDLVGCLVEWSLLHLVGNSTFSIEKICFNQSKLLMLNSVIRQKRMFLPAIWSLFFWHNLCWISVFVGVSLR